MFRREPSRSQWLEVMRRDSYTCQYCGRQAAELDHVVPWGKGGLTIASNLVAACQFCNRQKGDRNPDEWRRDQALAKIGRMLQERRTRRGAIKASLQRRASQPIQPNPASAAFRR
jgi:5-methylcytosine-specific restriction endonuclease McrA